MKAVIYARYSSDNQREESIDGQIRECTAFAEKNGITILRHYIDRACSAKTDNRPAFQEMVKDSVKKLFDMVIVWKLDRFARNRYDSARYKAQLKKNGVKVVSATEVISEGAEGIILESVLEGYAEYYSADLSEKVIRGRTDNALKCMYNGGTLPIGFVIDEEQHFQIDPLTAPFVLEVFKRYDEGATMRELRDWLNENGIRNKLGKPLNYNSIQHMLKNRRYIGEYQYRDVLIPDGIPAIVPKELFDRVQEKIAAIKQRQALNTDTQTLKPDIRAAITGIVSGRTADDDFYGHLLQQMTVYRDGRVEVALNLLPAKWVYVLDGLEKYRAKIGGHDASSVPMSVSRPFSSG